MLKEKFQAERVDLEVVACMSDGNLASLGVSNILCTSTVKMVTPPIFF